MGFELLMSRRDEEGLILVVVEKWGALHVNVTATPPPAIVLSSGPVGVARNVSEKYQAMQE